jgi:ubiquinone/menaquinone biosynthesis C-methylase UbiE
MSAEDRRPTTPPPADGAARHGDVCSADHAGFLTTPLRTLVQNPNRLLRGLLHEGQTAVDLGCGPGFFTLPMAELVGPSGQVIAVDLQAEMLRLMQERAERRGLSARIRAHQCPADSIGLSGPVDFALAFYMVHEVPDARRFLGEVAALLRQGGRLLLVEPNGHVSADDFRRTLNLAEASGLKTIARPRRLLSRAALLERV